MIKILYISSSRADFGIIKNLLLKISKDKNFILKILVTGSHFSKSHGMTYKEILNCKLKIDFPVKINLKKKINMSEISSKILKETNKVILNFKPDICMILGDRYELLGAALASYLSEVPIAHIHGGEKTFGAIDDSIRHAITKLSFIHLVSHNEYKKRVLQLGENKNTVINVGGLGAENISKLKFLTLQSLKRIFKIQTEKKYFIITFHSETFNSEDDLKNLNILFKSLEEFEHKYFIIFTSSNFDKNGNDINNEIKKFIKKKKNNRIFIESFGQNSYLSLAKYSSIVIGNSSSGILEIPSLGVPTLNLGARQDGRVFGKSIVHSKFHKSDLIKSINKCLSMKLKKMKNYNPYFKINTSDRIIKLLKNNNLRTYQAKNFQDIKFM